MVNEQPDESKPESSGPDGLSAEEMSLLARPVSSRAERDATRPQSGRDLAESLPQVLEPYLNGLHAKIDGLSARVDGLSEAIDRKPSPEVVQAEVIPRRPSAARPSTVEASGDDRSANRLFEELGRRSSETSDASFDPDPVGRAEPSPRLATLRQIVVLIFVAGVAALSAALLLWAVLGS